MCQLYRHKFPMHDDAAIVRYWAARAAHFREGGEIDLATVAEDGSFKRFPAPPEDIERVNAARHDPAEIVRLAVDRLGIVGVEELTTMPQQQRLVALRNHAHPSFSSFVEWLSKAIEKQVPDGDLAACAAEFLANPDAMQRLKKRDFDDGMVAYVEGKAMTDAWALLKSKAGPRLMYQLVYVLPVERGFETVKATDLASMPEAVLSSLLSRRDEGGPFLELADLIRTHPERFPEAVVDTLKRDDEEYFAFPDAKTRADSGIRHALDRQAATIEAVIEMRHELERLRARLEEVYEATARKRGLFG